MEKHDVQVEHSHSYGIYILVWLGLLAFTGLTVAIAGLNIGRYTVATALIIASTKTYLVLIIFMHLRSESKVFRIFVFIAVLFLVFSFILLFSDYSFQ